MKTNDVVTYFRSIVDENDKTFLTDAEVSSYLTIAYQEFRRQVVAVDTTPYEELLDLPAPAADTLSLDNVVLGTTPTHDRLLQMVRLCTTDGATPAVVKRVLRPANSLEELRAGTTFGDIAFFLQGRILRFNAVVSDAVQLQYIPASTLVWASNLNVATFIDDVAEEFGDLIALFAVSSYRMKDFSANPFADQQVARRVSEMRSWLSTGRNGQSARYVSSTDWVL